jgi:hypothetical protein
MLLISFQPVFTGAVINNNIQPNLISKTLAIAGSLIIVLGVIIEYKSERKLKEKYSINYK